MHQGQSLVFLIAFVIWVIRQIAAAAGKSKKNQSLNSYQPRPTQPVAPPVQQIRPIPQQFSAPVQSTPQYVPQQPPQYAPQQPQPYVPQQQPPPYTSQQQYGAYPPAANYGQGVSPYSNPVPTGSSPSYGPQGPQFGQGQYGTGQYGNAYPAAPPTPVAAASAYPAAQAYGQRDQDPYGQYGQSRQDTDQRYGHPGPQAQVSASPANYPVQSQPDYSTPRVQKTRVAQPASVTSSQDASDDASGRKGKGIVSGLFTSRNAIVRAVMLQEVLGPPKSKR